MDPVQEALNFLSADYLISIGVVPQVFRTAEEQRDRQLLLGEIELARRAKLSKSPARSENQESAEMSSTRALSTMLLPPSIAIPPSIRDKAMNDAKDYQRVIEASLRGSRSPEFQYLLKELIGKGSYGRVYLAISKKTGQQVAIKIINIEALDTSARSKPLGLEDAQKEIDILARLRDFPTVNVNVFVEAFPAHEHLCIVSEYCSGGSLTTLRRATPGNRLEEVYIRTIARELAFALRSVHAAGIVHRDVKCSNVMVNEDGKIQLIDFGVAGIVMTTMPEDRRKTVIGTPHWMPPELQWDKPEISHGTEVDVWAYGITLYECAMGHPPNATVVNPRQLRQLIRKSPARLTDETFTPELRDLIEFVLEPDIEKRPTMEQVCQHPYILDTEGEYPAENLQDLVRQYARWESQGGVRHSLWMAGGAEKVEPSQEDEMREQDDGWNFSTGETFRNRMSQIDPSFNYSYDPFSPVISEEAYLSSSPPPEDDYFDGNLTARSDAIDNQTERPSNSHPHNTKVEASYDAANADRGAQHMMHIFNVAAPEYQYTYGKQSDLPLRQGADSSLHRQELSVHSNNGKIPAINLEDISNKKRATMAWTWNDGMNIGAPAESSNRDSDFFADLPTSRQTNSRQSDFFGDLAPPSRPGLDRAATMPVGTELTDNRASTLDLDALLGPSSSYTHLQSRSGPGSFTDLASANSTISHSNLHTNQYSRHGSNGLSSYDHDFSEEPMDSFEAEMASAAENNNFTMRPATYAESDRHAQSGSISQLPADLVSSPAGSTFDDVARDIPASTSANLQSQFEAAQANRNTNTGFSDWQPRSRPPAWMNGGVIPVSEEISGYTGGTGAPLPYETKCKIGQPPVFGVPEAFDDRAPPEVIEKGLKFHIKQAMDIFSFLGQQLETAYEEEMAHIDRTHPSEGDSDEDDDDDDNVEGEEAEDEDAGYEGGQEYFDHGDDGEENGFTTEVDGENGTKTASEGGGSRSA